ncbi:hypothetical protein BTVI_34398 [Pitangus sulphuratus]|nr:hypothetical protein BTVI_34398 [Pitangus sulphuratus]
MAWRVGGAGCEQKDTGYLLDNLLLWEKTESQTALACLQTRPDKEENNSDLASRQSVTRTHLSNVYLGAVLKLIKLYMNPNGDQFLPFISKVQPFEQTQLALGCLFHCTAEVCAAAFAPVCVCQVANHPLGEESLSNIHPKPPLTQLQAVPSGPVTSHHREEISACPCSSPHEEVPLQVEQTK